MTNEELDELVHAMRGKLAVLRMGLTLMEREQIPDSQKAATLRMLRETEWRLAGLWTVAEQLLEQHTVAPGGSDGWPATSPDEKPENRQLNAY